MEKKMIKKQMITPILLLATILMGGITGCSGSKSSDATNPDASGTNVSQSNADTPNNNKADTPERAQKREEIRKQIEAVLTPDQVKQLQEKVQKGEKFRKAVLSLDLTADQKTKIQDIFKTAYPHRPGESKKNS
jgi:Spy/CpxP family protein refolding chaperone